MAGSNNSNSQSNNATRPTREDRTGATVGLVVRAVGLAGTSVLSVVAATREAALEGGGAVTTNTTADNRDLIVGVAQGCGERGEPLHQYGSNSPNTRIPGCNLPHF